MSLGRREFLIGAGAAVLGTHAVRAARLRREFGPAFETIEIDEKCANPRFPKPAHSVLTNHHIDEAGEPTREALDRTLAFLKEQLMPAAQF